MQSSTPTPIATAIILIRGLLVCSIIATSLELIFGITGSVLITLFPIWGVLALLILAFTGALIYTVLYSSIIVIGVYFKLLKKMFRQNKSS